MYGDIHSIPTIEISQAYFNAAFSYHNVNWFMAKRSVLINYTNTSVATQLSESTKSYSLSIVPTVMESQLVGYSYMYNYSHLL